MSAVFIAAAAEAASASSSSSHNTSLLFTFWFHCYNSDDSFLPLYLPLAVWLSAYTYCVVMKKKEFHRWYTIHNLHNGGAILLGSLSIYSGFLVHSSKVSTHVDFFNERIPILWSLSYFIVDALDCAVRRDAAYLFHAACCAVLGLANYRTPLLRELRMNSKAAYCELSNPFMHLAKRTRRPVHFALFAAVFTCCRMLWLPVLYRQLLVTRTTTTTAPPGNEDDGTGMDWKDPVPLVLAAFYGLNAHWWFKIVRILYDGLFATTTTTTTASTPKKQD